MSCLSLFRNEISRNTLSSISSGGRKTGRRQKHFSRGMKISVIIPHLNQEAFLSECLHSIMQGDRPADEIIVADNGSIVLPSETCGRFPNVILLVEPTPGPGPARNTGVLASTGDIVAFIDADCRADRGWLTAVAARMKTSKSGILGGDVRIGPASPEKLTMLEAYESIYSFRMDLYIKQKGFSGTGNLAVRRNVLNSVGQFAGIDVAEDKEWGNRALRLGHATEFVPEMLVFHPARRNFRDLFRKWDRQIAHEFVETAGTTDGRLRWFLRLILLPVSILWEIPKILTSNRIHGASARLMAIVSVAVVRVYRTGRMLRYLAGLDREDVSRIWNRP
jgi:glycosyltransferase involved in cell wall biosynthesis